MSTTRTAGQALLDELTAARNALSERSARWPLSTAIHDVLTAFLAGYDVDTDTPDCPNCGEGCSGHNVETYHAACGEAVENCPCIRPYLALARAGVARRTDLPA